MRKTMGWTLAWVVAATVAVLVGVVAVASLGADLRGRGPIGDNEAIRQAELAETSDGLIDPDDAALRERGERREIEQDFGVFVVECQGPYAVGIDARPNVEDGWQVVSIERRPDDDVDAVFLNDRRSAEIEVFCNQGVPTVNEVEYDELTERD